MQFFKSILLLCAFSVSVSANQKNKYDVSSFQDAANKAVEKAKENGWLKDIDKPTIQENDIALAKSIADQAVVISSDTMKRALPQQENKIDLLEGTDGAIFVSFSMPRRALIDAFKVAKEHNLTILFRGLEKGATHISSTMKLIQKLSAISNVEPNVGINPLRFKEFNVTGVPTIVIRNGNKHLIAQGTLNAQYAKEQFDQKQGDFKFEPLGQLFNIDEPDIIEQMKAVAGKIDWAEKQRLAKERFWKKYKTYPLPTSDESKQWLIDTTVRVTQDIKNGRGEILARAGDITNPLKQYPMHLTIFVIDPYVKSQVDWVKEELKSISGQFQIHLTHMDKDKGWDDLSKFRNEFGAPVFILPKQVIEKFKVEATPSKIETQSNGYLLVRQFDWSEK